METMYYFNHELQCYGKFLTDLQSFAKTVCAAFISVGEEGKRMKREAWLQLAPVRKIPMNL